MFSIFKSGWNESGIVASVDGVLREASKGNALEVQKWYYKVKKDSNKLAITDGITPKAAEIKALSTISSDKLAAYYEVVGRLSQRGGPLYEVNEWLKNNVAE